MLWIIGALVGLCSNVRVFCCLFLRKRISHIQEIPPRNQEALVSQPITCAKMPAVDFGYSFKRQWILFELDLDSFGAARTFHSHLHSSQELNALAH